VTGKIVLFDESDRQPSPHSVTRDANAIDPTADDQHVEF